RDQPIAQRYSLPLFDAVAGVGIQLGDLHALRTRQRAQPTTGAVVGRPLVRRLARRAETLGLRSGVFGPREQRRHIGDRTDRLADCAFDAVVEGAAQVFVKQILNHAVAAAPSCSSTDPATKPPVESAMPSPDPS